MQQANKSANAATAKTEPVDSVASNTNIVVDQVEANSIQAADRTLTPAEIKLLAVHEKTIGKGIKTFKLVYHALHEISEQRLYRAEFDTFEDYCRAKWDITARHANRLMSAGAVVANIESDQLVSKVPAAIPKNEAQARALASLTPPQQIEAAQIAAKKSSNPKTKEFKESAEEVTGEKPRAKAASQSSAKASPVKATLESLIELIDEVQTMVRVGKPTEAVLAKLKAAADLATRINNGGHVC